MDNLNTHYLAADQCRARAALIRQTAKEMKVEAVRLSDGLAAGRFLRQRRSAISGAPVVVCCAALL
jgi:hypothetical protein